MKLSYNILCVDDEIESLSRAKDDFRKFNAEVGIDVVYHDVSTNPGPREKPEELEQRIREELTQKFKHNIFELILVDLHMKLGINGQKVIEWIRESHSIYRPVIFYSGGTPPADDVAISQLSDAAKSANILGKNLMITSRSGLLALLKEIAGEMHREEHKVNQVRGLLMDQVSEIDAKMIKVISSLWSSIPASEQSKVQKALLERLDHKLKVACEIRKKLRGVSFDDTLKILDDEMEYIGTFARAKILRSILKAIPNLSAQAEDVKDFCNGKVHLMGLRNDYAHKSASDIEIGHDDERCKFIREKSRKYNASLDEAIQHKQ